MSLTKQVPSTSVVKEASSFVNKFTELKTRVEAVKQKRSERLALLEMYKGQYNRLVQQVKDLGVEKVADLPAIIKTKEAELLQHVALLEEKLQQAESILNGQAGQ